MHPLREARPPLELKKGGVVEIKDASMSAIFCTSNLAPRPSISKRWPSRRALSSSGDALSGTFDRLARENSRWLIPHCRAMF